jgi:hypothetical protein
VAGQQVCIQLRQKTPQHTPTCAGLFAPGEIVANQEHRDTSIPVQGYVQSGWWEQHVCAKHLA